MHQRSLRVAGRGSSGQDACAPARVSGADSAGGKEGLHVAVIMDGNGRWAAARGESRTAGHRAGAVTAERIVEAAPRLGVRTLTLYAFSSDNWQRPQHEVSALMRLMRKYVLRETARCVDNGVQLTVLGRRDRLSSSLRRAIAGAEKETAGGDVLHLRVAIDYSSRDAILLAARRLAIDVKAGRNMRPDREYFARLLAQVHHDPRGAPDVDLLVRTGGERRLSDFLLWECAYAELYFSPVMWPDFTPARLEEAISEFRGRERRFGKVVEQAV